tara:strand:+ start:119 stop:1144 length:1026 start_codon:yes stop_codon:yes gene_type:complete
MSDIGHNNPPGDEAASPGGWVKVYRESRDHHLVGHALPVKPADPKRGASSRGEAWQDLIMEAQYSKGRADIKGETIWLDVGQLLAARSYLAKRWNWSEQQVRTYLDRLESEGMIKRNQPINQLNNQGKAARFKKAATIISICNYTRYQSFQRELSLYVENHKTTKEITNQTTIQQPMNNHSTTIQQPESKKERTKEEATSYAQTRADQHSEIEGLNGNTALFVDFLAEIMMPHGGGKLDDAESSLQATLKQDARKMIVGNVNAYSADNVSAGMLELLAQMKGPEPPTHPIKALAGYIKHGTKEPAVRRAPRATKIGGKYANNASLEDALAEARERKLGATT